MVVACVRITIRRVCMRECLQTKCGQKAAPLCCIECMRVVMATRNCADNRYLRAARVSAQRAVSAELSVTSFAHTLPRCLIRLPLAALES